MREPGLCVTNFFCVVRQLQAVAPQSLAPLKGNQETALESRCETNGGGEEVAAQEGQQAPELVLSLVRPSQPLLSLWETYVLEQVGDMVGL